MHNLFGGRMGTLKHKQPEGNIRDAISRNKLGDAEAISENRMTVIRGYAHLPGGPVGVRIVDEKAFKEFQDSLSGRPLMQGILEQLKVLAAEYGEVPWNWLLNPAKRDKAEITAKHNWLITPAKENKVSESTVKHFCGECKNKGILIIDDFVPKNEAELNFFIGEAAYFSRIFRTYHLHPTVPKEFFNLLAYSRKPEQVQALHHWYDKEGKSLAKIGFSGEERASLLGCGLTAEWMDKLKLSTEDALFLAEHYSTCWRVDALNDVRRNRARDRSN
jgi:hypothetical protein